MRRHIKSREMLRTHVFMASSSPRRTTVGGRKRKSEVRACSAEPQRSLATSGDPNIIRAIPAGAVVSSSSGKGCGMPASARGCRSLHELKPRRRDGALIAEQLRVPRGTSTSLTSSLTNSSATGVGELQASHRAMIPLEPDCNEGADIMPTQIQTNATSPSALEPSPIWTSPIRPLRPSGILLVPSSITDAATKAKVDAEFNTALNEAIEQTVGSLGMIRS